MDINAQLDSLLKEPNPTEHSTTLLVDLLSNDETKCLFISWLSSRVFPRIGSPHSNAYEFFKLIVKGLPLLKNNGSDLYNDMIVSLFDWILHQLTCVSPQKDISLIDRLLLLFSNYMHLVSPQSLASLSEEFINLIKSNQGHLPDSVTSFMAVWLLRLSNELNESFKTSWSDAFVTSLVSIKWPSKLVLPLVSSLKEYKWANKSSKMMIKTVLNLFSTVDWQDWPPLSYQLILLARKNNFLFLIYGISKHFNTISELEMEGEVIVEHNDLMEDMPKEPRVLPSLSVFQQHQVEGSVILHILFSCQQDKTIIENILRWMRLSRANYVTPFNISLSISLFSLKNYENKVKAYLRSCFLDLMDFEVHRHPYSSKKHLSAYRPKWKLSQIVTEILKRLESGWQHLLQGAIKCAFLLVDLLDKCSCLTECLHFVLEIYKKYEVSQVLILQSLIEKLIHAPNKHLVTLFHRLLRVHFPKPYLVENLPRLMHSLKNVSCHQYIIEAFFPVLTACSSLSSYIPLSIQLYMETTRHFIPISFWFMDDMKMRGSQSHDILNCMKNVALRSSFEIQMIFYELVCESIEKGHVSKDMVYLLLSSTLDEYVCASSATVNHIHKIEDHSLKALVDHYRKGNFQIQYSFNLETLLKMSLNTDWSIKTPVHSVLKLILYMGESLDIHSLKSFSSAFFASVKGLSIKQYLDWPRLFLSGITEHGKLNYLYLLIDCIEICLGHGETDKAARSNLFQSLETILSVSELHSLSRKDKEKLFGVCPPIKFDGYFELWMELTSMSTLFAKALKHVGEMMVFSLSLAVCERNSIQTVFSEIFHVFHKTLDANDKDWTHMGRLEALKSNLVISTNLFEALVCLGGNLSSPDSFRLLMSLTFHLANGMQVGLLPFLQETMIKLHALNQFKECISLMNSTRTLKLISNKMEPVMDFTVSSTFVDRFTQMPLQDPSLLKAFFELVAVCSETPLLFVYRTCKEMRWMLGDLDQDTVDSVEQKAFKMLSSKTLKTAWLLLDEMYEKSFAEVHYAESKIKPTLDMNKLQSLKGESNTCILQQVKEVEGQFLSQLTLALKGLQELAQAQIKGYHADHFYQMTLGFFKCATLIPKTRFIYFPEEGLSDDIITFVKHLSTFTKAFYHLIPSIQQADLEDYRATVHETEGKKRKKEPFNIKSKITKESRYIPNIIFEIETAEGFWFKLAKRTQNPIIQYFTRSIARDFRIQVQGSNRSKATSSHHHHNSAIAHETTIMSHEASDEQTEHTTENASIENGTDEDSFSEDAGEDMDVLTDSIEMNSIK